MTTTTPWRHTHRPVDLCGHRPDEFCDQCCDCKAPAATGTPTPSMSLQDAIALNAISTRLTELRNARTARRARLAADATDVTVGTIERHTDAIMRAEAAIEVYAKALEVGARVTLEQSLGAVVREAVLPYMTFEHVAAYQENNRRYVRMLAAEEIIGYLDGVR